MQLVLILITLAIVLYIAYVQHSTTTAKHPKQFTILVDSCALIDGRILDLVRSQFLPFRIVIPKQVLNELQLLADGHDSQKRERARFGLEIIKQLQLVDENVIIGDEQPERGVPTDEQLVRLAKEQHSRLFTTDYNLQQIATIQDVPVLNPNELSMLLRPTALPGEKKMVKIVQKGSGRDQGVGYMEDGTMVVVDNAGRAVGKIVETEITRTHQTASGKMLFGALIPSRNATEKPLPKQETVARRLRKSRVN